jgi:hypothetical protein
MAARVSVRRIRILTALVVVMGILAMHGLVSAHQSAAASPVVGTVLAAVAEQGHGHGRPAIAAADAADHTCDLSCQSSEHALALLCAAVLLAAAGGLLLPRLRTATWPRQGDPPGRTPFRTAASPRSFDLVAELCISRT